MVSQIDNHLTIDNIENCPQCGGHSLKKYTNDEFLAVRCSDCLLIGGVLPHTHLTHSIYDRPSRWQLVFYYWNTRNGKQG